MSKDYAQLITAESLDRIVENMDEGAGGSMWVEFLHMEEHGFDIARQRGNINYYARVEAVEQDLAPEAIPLEIEREIAVAIRRRLRAELGKAPPSPEEDRTWRYDVPDWAKRANGSGPPRSISEDDVREVVAWIRANDFELVRYAPLVIEHNRPLGFNGGPHDREIIRARWAKASILCAATHVIGARAPGDLSDIEIPIWNILGRGGVTPDRIDWSPWRNSE